MTFWILTLFPQLFEGVFSQSIIKRAQEQGLLEIKIINLRDFSKDKHQTVDDKPYGGGAGMVIRVDVIVAALEAIQPKPSERANRPYSILTSASGERYTQQTAIALSKKKKSVIVCGHYEGIDNRVEKFVDEVLSIGDFILTGGEIAAMAIIDSTARLIPQVIKTESLESESFLPATNSQQPATLLEFPQYTRPSQFRGLKIPQILLSGNHREIEKWRLKEAIKRTKKYRPDLLEKSKWRK